MHIYTHVYHICTYNTVLRLHMYAYNGDWQAKIGGVRHSEMPWNPGQLVVQLHSRG